MQEPLSKPSPSTPTTDALIDRRRVAELEAYDVIGRPAPSELFDLANLAAVVCAVPTAAINLDGEEQHGVATYGIATSACTRKESMCDTALHETDALVLHDAPWTRGSWTTRSSPASSTPCASAPPASRGRPAA